LPAVYNPKQHWDFARHIDEQDLTPVVPITDEKSRYRTPKRERWGTVNFEKVNRSNVPPLAMVF